MSTRDIRLGQSNENDVKKAVAQFHQCVEQADMELVLFFCSSEYDLDGLAAEMNDAFLGVQVLGCTAAGEFASSWLGQHGLCGVSFAAGSFTAVSELLPDISHFDIGSGDAFVQPLLQRLEHQVPDADDSNSFAFMLIDGLCAREEPVSYSLQYALGRIKLFGGSAGDDQKFQKTHVYYDGRFHSDCAVLMLIHTVFPFMLFKTQHFEPGSERLVVTQADTENRIVMEINGYPAAEEYARLTGVEKEDLMPDHFARYPLVVMIDGTLYVRSIQKQNDDGSLTFFCAIEEGLVLRIAQGINLIENLETTFSGIQNKIGEPQLILGCDCTLRHLEVCQHGLQGRVSGIFQQNNVLGFNSYGEQFQGVHVNQTFTGVAIGSGSRGDD